MKKHRLKYEIEPHYVLMFATIAIICLIFASYKFESFFIPVKQTVSSCMAPMQKGIYILGNGINEIKDKMTDKEKLLKENESLLKENEDLRNKNNELLADSYELNKLRELFQLSESYSQYETIGAHIIASDSSGYNSVFTIDKGSSDGIEVDMNVIAGTGLVGIVTSVGDNYAYIRSIIDDNSNVSATILKTSESCMVSGNLKLLDEGYIEVSEIPLSSEVKNNYQIVTSSLSSKYLPGILIGYVSNVSMSSDGLSQEAYLSPAVNFNKLDTVLVITTLKEAVPKE